MAEHTPTPWALWPTHWAGGWGPNAKPCNRIQIQCDGLGVVAYVEHHGVGDGNDKAPTSTDYANARFIETACNSHDALLEACKKLLAIFATDPACSGGRCDIHGKAIGAAMVAIAAAEENPETP